MTGTSSPLRSWGVFRPNFARRCKAVRHDTKSIASKRGATASQSSGAVSRRRRRAKPLCSRHSSLLGRGDAAKRLKSQKQLPKCFIFHFVRASRQSEVARTWPHGPTAAYMVSCAVHDIYSTHFPSR